MNEENTQEEPSKLVDAAGTPITPEPSLGDKLEEVRRKLGLNNDGDPMDETPDQEEVGDLSNAPSGSDVDWSAYDLDAKYAHLYRLPSTKLRMGAEGPAWVAIVDDFRALRAPYVVIGRCIAQLVNGPEQWRLQSAVVPGGQFSRAQCKDAGFDPSLAGGVGLVTLQRKVPIILPTPSLLKSEQEDAASVPAPKDEELQQAEDAALAWINSPEGQAAPVNDADTPTVTPPALIEREGAAYEVAPGAVAAANDALKATEG